MFILLISAIHSEFCFIHNIFAFWNSVEFLISYLNLIPCQELYDYFDPYLLHFNRHFQCFLCVGTNIFWVHICTQGHFYSLPRIEYDVTSCALLSHYVFSIYHHRLYTIDYGLRTTDYGLRTTDYRLQSLD